MHGQSIGQFDPAELVIHVCMVLGREFVWGIKAASRNVDFVQEVFVLEGQLCAALRTDAPRSFRSRPEPRGLTAHEPELRSRNAEPRDERSAGGSTADRAMAVGLVKGCPVCLVTDLRAITSAPKHCICLPKGLIRHEAPVASSRVLKNN